MSNKNGISPEDSPLENLAPVAIKCTLLSLFFLKASFRTCHQVFEDNQNQQNYRKITNPCIILSIFVKNEVLLIFFCTHDVYFLVLHLFPQTSVTGVIYLMAQKQLKLGKKNGIIADSSSGAHTL